MTDLLEIFEREKALKAHLEHVCWFDTCYFCQRDLKTETQDEHEQGIAG